MKVEHSLGRLWHMTMTPLVKVSGDGAEGESYGLAAGVVVRDGCALRDIFAGYRAVSGRREPLTAAGESFAHIAVEAADHQSRFCAGRSMDKQKLLLPPKSASAAVTGRHVPARAASA